MNHEEPLDLRSLAAVESPEVVSAALRRFRRRILSTGAFVLLAALSLVGGILWAVAMNRTLAERIEGSPGDNVGAVFERSGVTVVLTRVAEVDSGLGLSFLVADPTESHGRLFVKVPGAREFDDRGGKGAQEIDLTVPPTDAGLIRATLLSQEGCQTDADNFCTTRGDPLGTFTIDLNALDVPDEIWRERN